MNIETAIVVSVITLLGTLYNAWYARRQTPAQKEKDIITNYEALFNQYRLRAIEQENELTNLEQDLKNAKAILLKRELDCDAEVKHIKHELRSYQAYSSELRRFARRYAPKDITLPEMNGHSSSNTIALTEGKKE